MSRPRFPRLSRFPTLTHATSNRFCRTTHPSWVSSRFIRSSVTCTLNLDPGPPNWGIQSRRSIQQRICCQYSQVTVNISGLDAHALLFFVVDICLLVQSAFDDGLKIRWKFTVPCVSLVLADGRDAHRQCSVWRIGRTEFYSLWPELGVVRVKWRCMNCNNVF